MDFNIIVVIICLITISISLISLYYTLRTKKRYEKVVMRLGAGQDLTKILDKYIGQVTFLEKKYDEIIRYCNKLEFLMTKTISKVGIIRYDAYSGTRNQLSFVIALLDKNDNGVVINSIYGIDNSNVYAKPILKGQSIFNLSSEERDAIKNASENNLLAK